MKYDLFKIFDVVTKSVHQIEKNSNSKGSFKKEESLDDIETILKYSEEGVWYFDKNVYDLVIQIILDIINLINKKQINLVWNIMDNIGKLYKHIQSNK